jgi:hypothetical protein
VDYYFVRRSTKQNHSFILAIFTNIVQKEESIPGMQALGILGPDGQPNTEKFQWKTIPQGAATYGEFLTTKISAHIFFLS